MVIKKFNKFIKENVNKLSSEFWINELDENNDINLDIDEQDINNNEMSDDNFDIGFNMSNNPDIDIDGLSESYSELKDYELKDVFDQEEYMNDDDDDDEIDD